MPAGSPRLVIPTGHASITHYLKLATDPEEMSFSYGITLDTPDAAGLGAAVGVAAAAFDDNILPSISSAYTFTRCVGRGSPVDGPFVIEAAPNTVGGGGATALASNSAILVEKRSDLAGRQNRGRMFIPGYITDGEVDANGALGAGEVAARQVQVDDWLDQITVGTLEVVLFHSDFIHDPGDPKGTTNLANPNANNPTTVSSFLVDAVIATQRRRMR